MRRFIAVVVVGIMVVLAVPAAASAATKVPKSIDNAVSTYGTYGNAGYEAVGDCTLAAVADLLQTLDGMNGGTGAQLAIQPFISTYDSLSDGNVQAGLPVPQVLNYWQRNGIDGNKIKTWRSLSTSESVIKKNISQNGALYGWVEIPTTDYTAAMIATGVTWTTTEAPKHTPTVSAHAVAIVGYNAKGPLLATWGYVQQVSWNWWNVWSIGAARIVPLATHWTPNYAPPPPVSTSTVLSFANPPTVTNGSQTVNYLATVTGATTGAVSFFENGQPVTSCASVVLVSGTAACSLTFSLLSPGLFTVSASFSGDAEHSSSTSKPSSVNIES